MARTTRTLNPLHFEDLEPHRFEDMVRQLVYDFRIWHSLEAVGRLGADEGIDIRGVERVFDERYETSQETEPEDSEAGQRTVDRVWIVQCKRERTIGPKEVRAIVSNDLSKQTEAPYGYILTAACDFSKKSRDAFREAVSAYGVEEFFMWGKAELEDMLFQPKHDHLLFAYFGISISTRRRSIKSEIASNLALKKKIQRVIAQNEDGGPKFVLIRDPQNKDYPFIEDLDAFIKLPLWRYWEFWSQWPIGSVSFIKRKCYAYCDLEKKEWDALLDYDCGWPTHNELDLFGFPEQWNWERDNEKRMSYEEFWKANVPYRNQGYYVDMFRISYESILAVDDVGDAAHPAPHLLVDYRNKKALVPDGETIFIMPENNYQPLEQFRDVWKRIKFFPDVIPLPQWMQELKEQKEQGI